MSTMRKLAIVAGAWLLFATGPAWADGLSKFKELVEPKLPPGALVYKSGKALGDNGFSLSDVTITPPANSGGGKPSHIKTITVEDADFAGIAKSAPPNFLKMRIEGIEIPADAASGINLKEMAGIDKLSADIQLDYRIDPDKKTFTLNRLELNLNGLARLELAMTLDNVSLADVAAPDKAMSDTTLRTATLVYDDHSLLGKVLPVAAKMQGSDPQALIDMGKGMLEALRATANEPTQAVFDALISYMEDYAAPKGPLRLTLSPPDKVTADAITNAKSPDDVIKALGLTVSYAGTRKHASAAPPAGAGGPAKSAAAPGKPACAAGARLFVWHEDGWAAATAKDAASAGGNCVVRLDGGGPDDDVTVPSDKLLAWSLDGPGKSVAACNSGAKVLVESDGAWYPAKITDKPATDGKCAIKYAGGDGDEEVVPQKRIRTLD